MKSFVRGILSFFKSVDIWLVLFCIMASSLSVIFLYSIYQAGFVSGNKIVFIQLIASVIGICGAFIMSFINYNYMAKYFWYHLIFNTALVVLTYFIGTAPPGTDDYAWLDLGFTTLQPAELLKISFIITFALHLATVKGHINQFKTFMLICLHGGIMVGLIVLQGDLGTALVFLFIFIFMLFAGGLSFKLILLGFGVLISMAPIVWNYMLPDYLKRRFFVAFTPELDPLLDGYQQLLGKVAIGSGKIFGKGITHDGLMEVPESYNDFIFSFIGQVSGFIGCVAVLVILLAICCRIIMISIKTKDLLGSYICVGVFAMIFAQMIINIGMVLCLLPVVGITLPFFSSGGSSVVSLYLCIGLVLSVYRYHRYNETYVNNINKYKMF